MGYDPLDDLIGSAETLKAHFGRRITWIGKTVVERLTAHAGELRAQGVSAIYLFGSAARDQARRGSDVDLFFDSDDPKFSLIELVRVKNRLGEILGIDAGVMTGDGLHPGLKGRIEASAVRVF